MRAIKLTLSTDPKLRAPTIQDEARWMQKEGSLLYPLNSRPRYAGLGCWVYFIRDRKLVARAKVEKFKLCQGEKGYTYTGQPVEFNGWHIGCSNMQLATKPISYRGFQGFRYVTLDEQKLFENAFE